VADVLKYDAENRLLSANLDVKNPNSAETLERMVPEELVAEMVAADKEEAAKEALLRRQGFAVVGSMENPPSNAGAVIANSASKGAPA
jgi:hypothetical protein